jgi:ribosomal protein S6
MEVSTEAVRGRTPQKEVEMNRTYEIMFIVRPDVEEVELDKLIETFSGYVTGGGGTVKTTEKMGRRRLAYTVKKFNDGFYVLLVVDAPASLISEIERRLGTGDQVPHGTHGRGRQARCQDQGSPRCAREAQRTAAGERRGCRRDGNPGRSSC